MRHYIVVPEGDDVEVTFMYTALASLKRVYTAPPRIVAEVVANEREAFWQDLGRPVDAPGWFLNCREQGHTVVALGADPKALEYLCSTCRRQEVVTTR